MGHQLRRQLHYKNQRGYDPYLLFDVDAYLTATFPTMHPNERKSVWLTCQSSFEIDWEDITDQIDECVYELFEDKYIEIVYDDDEELEDDKSDDDECRNIDTEEISDDVSTKS